VNGIKQIGQSVCGERNNELTCCVEDSELNKLLSNWWLLRKDYCA
jgi:hypothetical protein